jgi:phosphatidate cytidylyltransferase
MALNLQTLKTRSISAVVFVLVLLSMVYYSYYSFYILFFCVAIWGLKEFYDLAEKTGASPMRFAGLFSGVLLFLSVSLRGVFPFEQDILNRFLESLIYLVPFVVAIAFLFSNKQNALISFTYTLSGIMYAVLPFALLVKIPVHSQSFGTDSLVLSYQYFQVMGIIFLIWANDTFAYIGGSLIGKHKMMERVSPGKTWEGTAVGVVCSVLVGWGLNSYQEFHQNWVWPMVAVLVGIFGTIGDLVESLIKRQAGVKDSGKIMPGHGGILDRFDSLLFVSPIIYVIVKLAEITA